VGSGERKLRNGSRRIPIRMVFVAVGSADLTPLVQGMR
jgi:hypothetical protein